MGWLRSSRVALGLALVALAATAAVALAATGQPGITISTPASGSTIDTWSPTFSISLADTVAISSSATLTVDGVARSVAVGYAVIGGHWEGDGCDVWWVDDYDYTHATVSYASPTLSDGVHNATIAASDASGNTNSQSWTFTVQAPPKLIGKTPADGTAVKGSTPPISATLSDNGTISSVSATLDGAALPGTWNAATKVFSATPSSALPDGTHTVAILATDSGGLSSTTSWQFSTINQASTTFSSPQPAASATATVWNPTVSLVCSDTAILTGGTMTIDGATVASTFQAAVDGHSATVTYVPAMLTDGTHAVQVRTTNNLGFASTYSWSFTVAAPPMLSVGTPADGGWATTLTPLLSATLADNSTIATSAVLVDGVRLDTTYDAATKKIAATPRVPLTDESTHFVSVVATDVNGYAGRREWSFRTHATLPTYSSASPAPGENIDVTSRRIAVNVSDAMGLTSTPTMLLDGKAVPCQWSYYETGGYWDGDGCDTWWVASYDYTRGTVWYDATALSNSVHTVSVRTTNNIGGSSSYDWSFGVASQPKLSAPVPADGAYVPGLTPTVTLKVAANAPVVSTMVTIDGQPTTVGYDATTKTLAATPVQPLTDEASHTVLASVTDQTGLSGSLTWGFKTDTTPPTNTPSPAANAVVAVANPAISLNASDTMGMATGGQMTLDGAAVPGYWSPLEIGGSWEGTGCDAAWVPVYDYTRGSVSYQPAPLNDGPHTVTAKTTNNAGLSTTTSWQFSVAMPPTISAPSPANDAWVNTLTPVIRATATDNGTIANATILLDGVPVTTIYDAATRSVSAIPSVPLADDSPHSVLMTVTDSVGASSSLSWSFNTHSGPVQIESSAPTTSTSVWNPTITAGAYDFSGLQGTAKMWIDGALVPSAWDYRIISEQWVGVGCDAHLETVYDYTHATLSYRPASLSDGTHTAKVEIANNAGTTLTRSWDFDVKAPPILSDHKPAPDTTVSSQTPTISIAVAENNAVRSVVATLDGKAADATYDPTTKRATVALPGPLDNDVQHRVVVAVDDTSGNRASTTWAFRVQIYADMPGLGTMDCQTCHTDQPAAHPMSNCDACHGVGGPVEDCRRCHGYWGHGSSEFDAADWSGPYACARCHQPAYAGRVPQHPADNAFHDTSRDMATCRPCHVASLTIEHNRRKDAAGNALTCATCHQSSDAKVKAAISTGNTDCAACHTASVSHQDVHPESTLPADCASCHKTNVVTEHLSNPTTQATQKDCDTCHATTNPAVIAAIKNGDTACSTCHAAADHLSKHVVTIETSCAGCHKTNLVDEHAKSTSTSSAKGCGACHPSPRSSLGTTWAKGCVQAGCHADGTAQAKHAGMDQAHTPSGTALTCAVSGCHSGTLDIIHAEATSTVDPQATGCLVCHANGAIPSSGSCQDCHSGAVHSGATHTVGAPCAVSGCHLTDVSKIHGNVGCTACHGEGKTPSLACVDCHATPHATTSHVSSAGCVSQFCHNTQDLLSVHSYNCSTCHPTPRSSFTTWDKTCTQSGCHVAPHSSLPGYSQHEPMRQQYPADSCSTCHSDAECQTCHYTDRTAPTTLSDVHTSYDGIALIHLTPSDGAGRGVLATYYQIDGGPITVGTRILVPTSGIQTHTLQYWSVDTAHNSETPHVAHFTIAPAELRPPTTTSDVQPSYTGSAAIALTATDHTGYGIAATYFSLDTASPKQGTSLSVAAPVRFSTTHTIEYWSVDNADLVEPHNTATFVVNALPDTIAPVTTSDAKTSYTGYATVTLAASDSGWGVAHTYYRLDGVQAEGTSVRVPPPATGTASHTLEYWSVDYAGNIETRTTKTFTVAAGGTGTIRFVWPDAPDGSWFYYYVYEVVNGEKRTIASGYNTTGTWSAVVPVSPVVYPVAIYFQCPEDPAPKWEYNSVLVNKNGMIADWWY